MTIGKKIGLGCLGFFVLIGAVVAAAFYFTAELAKVPDQFFALLKENKTQEAYQLTAKEFQSNTNFEDFKVFVDQTSLNKYESSSWHSRSIKNDTGRLEGTVSTSNKGNIPLQIDLVKEEGVWKILYVSTNPAGVDDDRDSEDDF